MSLRFNALTNLSKSEEVQPLAFTKITAIFAENVFTPQVARQFLSGEAS
jgi:glutamine synthetase